VILKRCAASPDNLTYPTDILIDISRGPNNHIKFIVMLRCGGVISIPAYSLALFGAPCSEIHWYATDRRFRDDARLGDANDGIANELHVWLFKRGIICVRDENALASEIAFWS